MQVGSLCVFVLALMLWCGACFVLWRAVASPGLVCFDLDSFLEMTQNSGKWQCPGTRNFHTWRQLQVGLNVSSVSEFTFSIVEKGSTGMCLHKCCKERCRVCE